MCSNGAKRDPPGFLGHQYARSIKSRWQGYIYIYYKVTGKGDVEYVRDPEFKQQREYFTCSKGAKGYPAWPTGCLIGIKDKW